MIDIPEYIRQEAKKELARRYFWDFEQALYPELFTDDRKLLKTVADTMQDFYENSDRHYLVISLPPGHYKSFTGKNFVQWVLGKDPRRRVISASNGGDLASTFSTQIRDTILGLNVGKQGIPYPQIFPNTKVKYGFATKSKWELEGSSEPSYRSTSPTSTLTGARADLFVIDDIIKNAVDALNEFNLISYWDWYRNTLFSRADGDNYKFIFIMQRWAKGDLSGRVIDFYGDDVEVVDFPVENESGEMLEPSIMSRRKLEEIRKTLAPEIFSANYYQKPMDIEGRLYKDLKEWSILPECIIKKNNTDVADQGKDYLSSFNWFEHDKKVYITDIYHSNQKAEITEPQLAKMLHADGVNEAEFESNNGGKGYARNIERELESLDNKMCVVSWTPQTGNKEARILASSAWIKANVYFPPNWTMKYPEAAEQVLSYVAGGKNKHDDAPDVLATIYERAANFKPTQWASASELL
jgi:predicted phage terminase large subunit-like protein